MRFSFLVILALFAAPFGAFAQVSEIQALLQEHRAAIEESSRRTIAPAIDALASSGLPAAQSVLEHWQNKEMYQTPADGLFYFGIEAAGGAVELFDFSSGQSIGVFTSGDLEQLKPNAGIRAMLTAALVQFQLTDPDPTLRMAALTSLQRDPTPDQIPTLRASIPNEVDPTLQALKQRVLTLLIIRFDADPAVRVAAIETLGSDISLDVRSALNPLLSTQMNVARGEVPNGVNLARVLVPGNGDLSIDAAYELLVERESAPAIIDASTIRQTLESNIVDGQVGGFAASALSDDAARFVAYDALVASGLAPARPTQADITAQLADYVIYEAYDEPSSHVTDAVTSALNRIALKVGANKAVDLTLDALSLASILFLAAIGLAITFGVMGVINMAHGEFIMMGAYTGYVVQQIVPNYTVSIILALPAAFLVTFAAGVAMERLVIRWLYNRPLETLLATFGISIALQQIAKNVFGTQARPLTSPSWLDGAWVLNDVVSVSYIRIAIFILAAIFLAVFLFVMKRTRLGLETRAVTQNPRMAASMGINTDRVNMLTFGLGSGIAGIAGVAIGLFAKVTSELGNDYIVQSFMTVVVGGVGNIWGALAGATMIGFFQKSVEWLNPSNTLAAQTYMIIFIIIFVQFRPRGIVALRGRAAGD